VRFAMVHHRGKRHGTHRAGGRKDILKNLDKTILVVWITNNPVNTTTTPEHSYFQFITSYYMFRPVIWSLSGRKIQLQKEKMLQKRPPLHSLLKYTKYYTQKRSHENIKIYYVQFNIQIIYYTQWLSFTFYYSSFWCNI